MIINFFRNNIVLCDFMFKFAPLKIRKGILE